ncbi:MAG TPA: GDP-mannose 4,6-dehydratase [Candidatus Synoicihabitans sp.]|nr:GDP-mannose 4,6-dehydratase [Candidatus Synoicihabitans sp.]
MVLQQQKVVVTGAGGFIGSHLCELLVRAGAEVTAVIRYSSRPGAGDLDALSAEVRRDLRVAAGNVEDPHFVREVVRGQDVIFHLAALIGIPYSYRAPHSYLRTNVEGTANVLEAARAHGVRRVVHTSTSEVYGTARHTPMNENHPLQAQSPYAASKIAADKLVESYHRSFGLPVVTVRPFNTYGPRQSARAVIPTIVGQALHAPEIRLGALTPVRDLTYVSDTARAFLRAAVVEGIEGETFNLGTGHGISIGELAQRVLIVMKVDKPIHSVAERVRPAESEVLNLISDNRKAARHLQWQPEVSLADGLAAVIQQAQAQSAEDASSRYVV